MAWRRSYPAARLSSPPGVRRWRAHPQAGLVEILAFISNLEGPDETAMLTRYERIVTLSRTVREPATVALLDAQREPLERTREKVWGREARSE